MNIYINKKSEDTIFGLLVIGLGCPGVIRTLCPSGPDTLSQRPGHSVRMARSTCPDNQYKVSQKLD